MARPKLIDDKELLNLIKRYFNDVCEGNLKLFTMPKITEYINNNGYPTYAVESLRRSNTARNYIDSLIQTTQNNTITNLVAYKTLDVDAFLSTNRTKESLKRALIDLDNYYRTIADAASEIISSHNKDKETINTITEELKQAQNQVLELKATIDTLKQENREIQANNKALKGIVNDYVYPEIANELLSRDSIIYKENSTIDPKQLDKDLIDGSSKITKLKRKATSDSNIINNLFSQFED